MIKKDKIRCGELSGLEKYEKNGLHTPQLESWPEVRPMRGFPLVDLQFPTSLLCLTAIYYVFMATLHLRPWWLVHVSATVAATVRVPVVRGGPTCQIRPDLSRTKQT